jgi:hypothetical protein
MTPTQSRPAPTREKTDPTPGRGPARSLPEAEIPDPGKGPPTAADQGEARMSQRTDLTAQLRKIPAAAALLLGVVLFDDGAVGFCDDGPGTKTPRGLFPAGRSSSA